MEIGVLIALILLLLGFFFSVPIVFSMIISTISYFIISSNLPLLVAIQRIVGGLESIPLLAIPFFITAGVFMNYTGISKRLINFADILTGHMNGGLAQVNVVLSTLMGGLSGSNLADSTMEAKILVPQMVKKGYSVAFSTVVTAFSSLITPIIPPGIALIIYGCIGNVSIGKLFLAGVIPGLLTCILMMICVSIISKKRHYKPSRKNRASIKEIIFGLKDAGFALTIPLVIIMGIRFGIFTPTEAGSIVVIFSFFLGIVVYKEMKISHFSEALKESVTSSANIMLIIAAASGFAKFLTWERIPQIITEWVTGTVDSRVMFLLVLNIFLLILGMILEGNAQLIVLTPILIPIAESYGIDLVHFGLIFIFNLGIGTLTPPLGTVMLGTCSITGCSIDKFLKEALPFYLVLLIALFIITYVPSVSLFLPNLVFK